MSGKPERTGWAMPLLATLAGLGLCLDQARLGYLARTAEVARLLEAPPLALWVILGLGMLSAGAVGLHGALRLGDVRRARVPVLAAVVVGFVDLFVTNPVRPMSARLDAMLPVQAYAELVRQYALQSGGLPTTPGELEAIRAGQASGRELPAPVLLVHGAPVEAWQVRLVEGCTGPVVERGDAGPGTLVYCLQDGGGGAWITAVARSSSTFGAPELLRIDGRPVVARVERPSPRPDAGTRQTP